MAHPVIMPQMGESIAEGTITTWLKKVGDRVARDEPLFEISTDKVDAEIPSPAAGVLREIKVQPGQTVAINTVVAILADEGEKLETSAASAENKAAPPPKSASAAATPAAPKSPGPGTVEELRRTKSSPLVRKIAEENHVDIKEIPGTGVSGRVTKDDILSFIDSAKTTRPEASSGQRSPSAQLAAPPTFGMPAEIPEAYRPRIFPNDRVEEMSVMRTRIAEHMVLSRSISAHVQTVWEVDFEHVAQLRAKYKGLWQERHDTKLTYTPFLLKATVDALKAVPVLNASMDQPARKVIFHQHVNLGMAVALDWGLIVPVIHNADELNTLGLARRAAELAEKARTKKLKPEDVQAGTFTLTNPGQFGQLFGLPVINQPQSAILGVGAIQKRPVVIDDMIAIRTRCYLALSFDHRLIDGAVAEQFMGQLKKSLEQFDEDDLQ